MSIKLRAEYDLFIDKSGTFIKSSTVPAERTEAFQQGRLFPSQLAGLLVPRGALTEGAAKQVRNRALAAIGVPPQPVHGNELVRAVGKERYSGFVAELASELRRQGWQPVRLVNLEQVRYGDRVATYTHLVAELILRICQQQQLAGAGPISLRVYAARLRVGETPEGEILLLPREEFLRRIREYLGFAARARAGRGRLAAGGPAPPLWQGCPGAAPVRRAQSRKPRRLPPRTARDCAHAALSLWPLRIQPFLSGSDRTCRSAVGRGRPRSGSDVSGGKGLQRAHE